MCVWGRQVSCASGVGRSTHEDPARETIAGRPLLPLSLVKVVWGEGAAATPPAWVGSPLRTGREVPVGEVGPQPGSRGAQPRSPPAGLSLVKVGGTGEGRRRARTDEQGWGITRAWVGSPRRTGAEVTAQSHERGLVDLPDVAGAPDGW